jgi:hypothetical protein
VGNRVILWQMQTRTKKPWSRDFLRRIGHNDIIERFEGRRPDPPAGIAAGHLVGPL